LADDHSGTGGPAGTPDRPTVNAKGESVAAVIDGLKTKRGVVHVDHRGRLFEVFNEADDYWSSPVVHSYVFTVRPGTIKGWGVHDHKWDRYCIISGEMLVVLWDGRDGSPTHGLVQEVVLSAEGVRMLSTPPGVWHVNINLGPGECVVMNHPTAPYDYAHPDRRLLPPDSPEIPVDLRAYYPIQTSG
jgi:dTDP-4-dehydrorhamnose 3,5-epimerase